MPNRQKLGKILLEAQIIKKENIEEALEEQRRSGIRFGEALVKLGHIKGEDVNWGLSHQQEVPFIRLRPEAVDPQAVALVPEAIARKYTLVPFFLTDDELTIVIDDPTKKRAIAEVGAVSGCTVKIALGLPEEISETVDEVYKSYHRPDLENAPISSDLFSEEDLRDAMIDPSAGNLLATLLKKSIEQKATAVHFEPRESKALFRLRVEGHIQTHGDIPAGWYKALVSKLRETAEISSEGTVHTEGFLPITNGDQKCPFYISFVRSRNGEAITLINISSPDFPDRLEDLDVSAEDRDQCLQAIADRSGTVMVVGTEKMEKLKFTYLLMKKKQADTKKTFSIGRMSWFADESIVQIKTRTEETDELLQSLKVVVAQDPDIIYIEDCWDKRVLTAALQSGMLRCFVFANLHLRSALSALEYALEGVQSKTLLCESLRGIIALAAFRRLCPKCKKPDDRSAQAARTLGVSRSSIEKANLCRAEGCETCHHTGYGSLLPIIEVFRLDEGISHFIKSENEFPKIRDHVLAGGHVTLGAKIRNFILAGELALDDYQTVE